MIFGSAPPPRILGVSSRAACLVIHLSGGAFPAYVVDSPRAAALPAWAAPVAPMPVGEARSTAPGSAGSSRVTLTIRVDGCSRCRVTPARTFGDKWWQGATKKVKDGKIRFTVPRRHTGGLYLQIWTDHPDHVPLINAQVVVAMRYRGKDLGDHVSKRASISCPSGLWVLGGNQPALGPDARQGRQVVGLQRAAR